MPSTSEPLEFNWPDGLMEVAAIVGHTTDTTTRLWFRTGQTGEFTVFLYLYDKTLEAHDGEQSKFTDALSQGNMTVEKVKGILCGARQHDFNIQDTSNDTTHVVDLNGLDPDTVYGYALFLNGDQTRPVLGHDRMRRFRTAAADSVQQSLQFAVFSCNKPYKKRGTKTVNLDMWKLLYDRHKHEIDFVVAGGDQCYCDGEYEQDVWNNLNQKMREQNGNLEPQSETMLNWYREVYRGYWHDEHLQRVLDEFPTYMIWDDHEIYNGWGSYYLSQRDDVKRVFDSMKKLGNKRTRYDNARKLIKRMFSAAKKAYFEYQHSHNPRTQKGTYDYAFRRGSCAFYVLDGRGSRDIEQGDYRILGRVQFERFAAWLDQLDKNTTPFLFVVSAIPVLHIEPGGYKNALSRLLEKVEMRDSWGHDLHNEERQLLLGKLFGAASDGFKVSIVSGDRHISAAFRMQDDHENRIYQLTSSPITHDLGCIKRWALKHVMAEDGTNPEGYLYKRLSRYDKVSYALISVEPHNGEARFKLYGKDNLEACVPLTW